MRKSENYELNLPSAEDPNEIADVGKISENFARLDVIIKENEEKIPASKSEIANVIKCKATGEVVSLKDISPLEHEIRVKLISDTLMDFSSVTLKKCGANLCNPYDFVLGKDWDGRDNTTLATLNMPCLPNKTYSVSWIEEAKGEVLFVIEKTSTTATTSNGTYNVEGVAEKTITTKSNTNCLCVLVQDRTAILSYDFVESLNIQIELGDETEHEPYIEPIIYPVNEDGTVEGVTSLYPTTTLLSDAEGVLIEAEYNADTKKYIDNKFAELQALILEV